MYFGASGRGDWFRDSPEEFGTVGIFAVVPIIHFKIDKIVLNEDGKIVSDEKELCRTFSIYSVCENPYKFPFMNIQKILNRPINKFYNSAGVNVIVAELRLTKMRPTSFYKKHNLLWEIMPIYVKKVLKTNVKNWSAWIAYCKLYFANIFDLQIPKIQEEASDIMSNHETLC